MFYLQLGPLGGFSLDLLVTTVTGVNVLFLNASGPRLILKYLIATSSNS